MIWWLSPLWLLITAGIFNIGFEEHQSFWTFYGLTYFGVLAYSFGTGRKEE